jgi:hypothetical protein
MMVYVMTLKNSLWANLDITEQTVIVTVIVIVIAHVTATANWGNNV